MPASWPQIPRDRLEIRFARSGGPGGQNVNKVETKAEIRFVLDSADWIPPQARERLRATLAASLTKDGELVVTSSRHRSQSRNLEDCFAKLEGLLRAASRRPRRRIATSPTHGSRLRTADAKRSRSATKRQRRWRSSGDD